MPEIDIWTPFQILHTPGDDLSVPLSSLPRQHVTGDVKVAGVTGLATDPHVRRCRILYGDVINGGTYASIRRISRDPAPPGDPPLCIKKPKLAGYSLCTEALIQWMAGRALEARGIKGAVPPVYDIFQYAGETRFSMEFVPGMNVVEFLATTADPEAACIQILAQVALLLGLLEADIHLDHRDLKADNVWIRAQPCSYKVVLGDRTWSLESPFQVVLLDFGFACLGGEDGNSVVSLSDGIIPKIDPCPKEGRDILHFVVTFWSIPMIRERMSPGFQVAMDDLLSHGGAPFAAATKKTTDSRWAYIYTSLTHFKYPPFNSVSLLQKLSSPWKGVGSLSVSEADGGN